jgi:hypothetical protein
MASIYRVDPRSARTDLYDVGKGETQVFDFGPTERTLRFNKQQAAQKKAAKQKEIAGRQKDLLGQISKVGNADIKPGDYDYFKNSQEELRNMAIKYFQPDGSISNEDYLKLQGDINNMKMQANLSKNQREAIETTLAQYKPGEYDVEDYQHAMELYNSPQRYNEVPSLRKNIDLTAYTNDELWKVAEHAINTGQRTNGRPLEFTEEDANKLLEGTFWSNQAVRAQAIRDAQKQLGPDVTPDQALDYYKKTQAPNLMAKKYNYTPASDLGYQRKEEEKALPVTITENQYGGNTYDISAKDVYTEVDNPNRPGEKLNASIQKIITEPDGKGGLRVKGAIATTKLTPVQSQENSDVRKYNLAQDRDKKKYLFLNPLPEKPTKGLIQSPEDYKKELNEWAAKQREVDKMFAHEPIPYKEETVNLDINQAQEVLYGQRKVKIDELLKNNVEGIRTYRPEDVTTPVEKKKYKGKVYGSFEEFKKDMKGNPEGYLRQLWKKAKTVVEQERKGEAPGDPLGLF